LINVVDNVVITTTPFRPQQPEATAAFYGSINKSVTVVSDASAAIQHAINITEHGKAIVVCGSFYLASSFQDFRMTR
jgi:folylpolyglutamate synthase/dihydropteroate synthase